MFTALSRWPVLGPALLTLHRARLVFTYLRPTLAAAFRWLFTSRETTNYTYTLTPLNQGYLAAFISNITGKPQPEINRYLRELDADASLRAHIQTAVRASPLRHKADATMAYGRRLGWYALVRATKPLVVVETGVEKGLGSVVLCAALLRNKAEGHPGFYYGTDIDPRAGWLLTPPYSAAGRVLYGDSIMSLSTLKDPVDVFINDSDHSAEYEAREYEMIAGKLAAGAYVVGDNAHVTDKLLQWAQATGRQFYYWQEQPQGHWYRGGGMGVAK